MQKKFITNLAFLLFLNLLIKPFWLLGIDRSVQNAAGTEAYGAYYALFNFSFLFNILLDLGITNFNNRNISQNRQLLDKHLSGIIMLRMALAVVYILVSLIGSLILGYEVFQLKMLIILLLNQVLISFILFLRSNLAGLHMFKTDSVISVLDRTIMIAICSLLLWGNVTDTPFQIEWFVWAQTSAYIITAIFTMIVLSRKAVYNRLKWDRLFFLMILKKSYPFAILILLMTFYNRIDSVMIERLLDNGSLQAGIYAQAYRLLDASNMIAFLFAGLLLPMFAHMLKLKQSITELLRLSYTLLAVPAVIIASIAISFRKEIMELLYHEHVAESSAIFAILMTCFFAISTTYIYGTLLTANGNLKQLNTMALFGMVLNVLLNLWLIPKYQAKGAAISSMITQFMTALIQVILCYRIFKLEPNINLILRFLIFSISTLALTFMIGTSGMDWKSGIVLSLAVGISISFILKLISIKSMVAILKQGDR
jgi:O-antigen/teichoic acid export membrane protein